MTATTERSYPPDTTDSNSSENGRLPAIGEIH